MITASIVLYKNSLEECHSILDCLLAAPVEKIYLVDHSGDERLSILKEYSGRIEYIPHENLGYGSGHNVAIKKGIELKSDYHLIINADILFEPGTIEKIQEYMDRNPDVAHVLPKTFYPNGELQCLSKMLPTPFDMFARGFLPKSWIRKNQRRFTLSFTNYDIIMNAPYLSGCFMFIRTKVLEEVNGFDERYFMYPEDADLTRRIHVKYKTIMYPEVKIVHNHVAAHRSSWKMKKVMIVNLIRYFNKWGWFFDRQRRQFNRRLLQELREAGKEL